MGWRQTTSGRTDSAKRSLEGKGEMQKKWRVSYYKANLEHKPREDKKGQWEDALLKVVK